MIGEYWWQRKRKPKSRPAPKWKYPSRWPRLDLLQLERRELPSSAWASLPGGGNPAGAEGAVGAAHQHQLSWSIGAQKGLAALANLSDTTNVSVSGAFSLTSTGTYSFSISVAGTGPASTFTLTAEGTASFTFIVSGNFGAAGYSITSASLVQEVNVAE